MLKCGQETGYVEEHDRWFCWNCQEYLPEGYPLPEEPILYKIGYDSRISCMRFFFTRSAVFFLIHWHEVGGGGMIVMIKMPGDAEAEKMYNAFDLCHTVGDVRREFPYHYLIPRSDMARIALKRRKVLDGTCIIDMAGPSGAVILGHEIKNRFKFHFHRKKYDEFKEFLTTYYDDLFDEI